nr:ABC transporter permease subunit [Desulfobacula sp.]
MTAYFIRRLLLVIPTFIGITIMVFTITRFVPGGPIERIISETRAMQAGHGGSGMSRGSGQPLSEEQITKLKAYYGFDKPLLPSYLTWLSKVVRGDLGISTRYQDRSGHDPGKDPVSLYFGILSLFMIYGVCIPLGMAKAVRHRTGFDNISSILIFTGYAIPGWVAGIFMLVLFSSQYDIFPLGGLVSEFFDEMSLFEKAADILWHTFLPLIAYVIGSFTVMTLLMKNTLMDHLSSDYMRTALAKGLSFEKAVFSHALQNSLIPMATGFGNNISILLTGSFLIEKVFNIDGMGLLGYESILDRDYPVVMGILVISSLLFLLGNILSDLCVALVDPRVRFK